MSASPKLSVVTISHDDSAGLRLTLDSLMSIVRSPTMPAWEHVVVDGSPAVNRAVLADLPGEWPLVHLDCPPLGVPDAFNHGLTVARGAYLWFLNGGDRLRDPTVLSRMLSAFDEDPGRDFICAGAYLSRGSRALYPVAPRRTLLANIVGRSWLYHQAVIYRRASLTRVGSFSTAYSVAGDYDFHVRCYLAGLRGRFISDVLVDYDMEGGSQDLAVMFREIAQIQRSHRDSLPVWINYLNEVIRAIEYGRIHILRVVASTRLGGRLRPVWAALKRALSR